MGNNIEVLHKCPFLLFDNQINDLLFRGFCISKTSKINELTERVWVA